LVSLLAVGDVDLPNEHRYERADLQDMVAVEQTSACEAKMHFDDLGHGLGNARMDRGVKAEALIRHLEAC
jgi:hypothetical protein